MAEKLRDKKAPGPMSEGGDFPRESGESDPYLNELDSSIEDLMSDEPTRFDIPAEVPPATAPVEEVPQVPEQAPAAEEAAPSDEVPIEGVEAAAGIPLQVHVVIGNKKTNLADLLSLKKGAILELEKGIDTTVDLVVQDKVIARGELVEVDGRMGVRLIRVLEEKG